MPKMKPIVDFKEKITHLCALVQIDRIKFINGLEKVGIKKTLSNRWFELSPPGVADSYRNKFLDYWYNVHHIKLEHIIFEMSLSQFVDYTEQHTHISPKIPDEFVGQYQLLRPHSSAANMFVLEAMSIYNSDFISKMAMYSNAVEISPKYMYAGSINKSGPICFSLIGRKHESTSKLNAYRCITLYIGDERDVDVKYLTGILLRGVSANERTANCAVGMPFIAIKIDHTVVFSSPEPYKDLKSNIKFLHRNHPIILGEITESRHPQLYQFCKAALDLNGGPHTDGSNLNSTSVIRAMAVNTQPDINLDIDGWRSVISTYSSE